MNTITDIQISVALQQLINADVAQHYKVVPCEQTENEISFYSSESVTEDVRDELEMLLGETIQLIPIADAVLEKALAVYYRKNEYKTEDASVNLNNEDFLEKLIFEAKAIGSSDIHFEVYEEEARVRL